MAEGNGLGHLQMGEARHDGGGMGFGLGGKGSLQVLQLSVEMVDRVPDIETEIEGHLIVTRACGVEPPGGGADQLLQAGFDIEVDILQRPREGEGAGLDLGLNGCQGRA